MGLVVNKFCRRLILRSVVKTCSTCESQRSIHACRQRVARIKPSKSRRTDINACATVLEYNVILSMENRTEKHLCLNIEHPDDEKESTEKDPMSSSVITIMKTAVSSLDSTRSRESMLVEVGQPFDEPPEEVDHGEIVMEEKKEEEPTTPSSPSSSSSPSKSKNARVLMLMSTFGRSQMAHQERARMLLESMRIPYDTIDGSAPHRKEERNALFELSGMRGVYPQFFLVSGNDIAVIGNFDALEGINEASSLPLDILQNNQEILTWDRLMGKTKTERMAIVE